ncbi:MAG: hypothetical protein O9282_05310 [Flavobacterium sp.]|jgi:hypothetical protein|uniref:hypothetical protein n=1 Tax=Flavobacterium sp. TaxID=239 RepID=UPI0022C6F99F|nr:hypothetical protein [Flavobacterium sp.]MCZ8090808.1 hypothetical protein [Flavobacterium sp.]MCZ8330711.1 hypothetical protein [Flavobacterium sp.]
MAKKLLVLLLFVFCCQNLTAQQTVAKDSAKVYKDIEKFSKKSKFGKFVHRLLFKSTRKSKPSKKASTQRYYLKKAFDKHEGKIIRNINIETLDPFGYSVDNIKDQPEKGIEKFGNALHAKSKKFTIRNILLFKKNEPLDSIIAKESERLIRRQRFVRSVIIKPLPIENNKDSVDISIRVLDSWSLIPTGSISGSRANFELSERNVFGLGHELSHDFTQRFSDKSNSQNSRYLIRNIKNSFTNVTLNYNESLEKNISKSIRVERLFFSPLTRLAGGIFLENRAFSDSLPNLSNEFETIRFKNETRDFWFGHAFKLFGGKNEDYRTTNLVTTIGYKKINYIKTPTLEIDPNRFFANEELYLASIGVNTRKFAEDKYLFNFGIIEDIPFGQVYSITGGFQNKNNQKRAYFGGRFAYGNYFDFGYLGINSECGSFFEGRDTRETTFKIEANYFTNLIYFGDWKIRQFIKSSIVIGNNRVPILKDRVMLGDDDGIQGFNNPLISGIRKATITLQTQTYVPGSWHGFRFSPFYNMTLGMLGNETDKFLNKSLLSKFSIGVLINNDYLVFNSFQISFSFYPKIPFQGTNIFNTNSYKNNDLSLPDYEIGQPTIALFR